MTNKLMPITEIKKQLMEISDVNDSRLNDWQADSRKGVQVALKQWQKRWEKEQTIIARFKEMQKFENQAYLDGYQFVAGIDEVGRGPLAGPVVSAAVILKKDAEIFGINDSKQLSHKKRMQLFDEIKKQAVSIGIGIIDAEIIDQVNIYEATKLAMQAAIDQLTPSPDFLLIDAMKLANGIPQENLIKGDARSISIAAASIIAKETRDQMMSEFAERYPGYGFEKNAGYGTKEHLKGLATFGVTPIHRRSFAPVKDM